MTSRDLGPAAEPGELLTTREAAQVLGVSPTSIKRWADAGHLPARRTAGGHRRYLRADVERLSRVDHEPDRADAVPVQELAGERELTPLLPTMTRPQLDALPVGVIQLSDEGIVLLYNATESRHTGLHPEHAEGKHFFGELAPCCNNRLVYGRFKEGVTDGRMDVRIDYTFTYRMRPTNVELRLYRHEATRTNWLLVKWSR